MDAFAGFSHRGNLLLLIVAAAFALGSAFGVVQLSRRVLVALILVGPVAAFIAYQVINPDPGCTYDCMGKLVWSLLLTFTTVAWWGGLALGALYRWAVSRSRSN